MKYMDSILQRPEEILGCDEALLESCENGAAEGALRVWSTTMYFVVLGYSRRAAEDVDLGYCRSAGIPVLRRISGGGTVLQGPGCLNYSLILRIQHDTPTATVTGTNHFVMNNHAAVLSSVTGQKVTTAGHTDLVVNDKKVSGNAQKRGRNYLLFHGTFLLDFDISLINKALRTPLNQPDYRRDRTHSEFLMNLHLSADTITGALRKAWNVEEQLRKPPLERITQLAASKYLTYKW